MKCDKCGMEYVGDYCPMGCDSAPEEKQRKKGVPSWLVILLLILFFPVGIILMWVNCNWKKVIKIIITIFFALAMVVAILGGDGTEESVNNNASIVSSNTSSIVNDSEINSSKKEDDKEVSEKDYKKSCEKVAYKSIARNPSKYNGKDVVFKGKVMQVSESMWSKNTVYLIQVTEGEYGLWDDITYVTYEVKDGEDKILEDDIVKLYGECKGDYSYTTVLGATSTVPKVEAKYIDIVS